MPKFYILTLTSLLLLVFGSCQSLEQISIDYMKPGELSFPAQLRKVAIVNNTSATPDNKMLSEAIKPKENTAEMNQSVAYANGDSRITIESLAKEIAEQNYFDVVVICDSVLRANDRLARTGTLTQEEVKQLALDLEVDFIIALENLQIKSVKSVQYLSEFGYYRGVIDVKTYPTLSIYLPGRSKPMSTIHPNDSIFWEEFGNSQAEITARMIPDHKILKEAAEFAGSIPVKMLLPYWAKGTRHLYTGGSVNMRDAAIYARENTWEKAYKLWLQAFESTKSNKKKMQAAHNIALYYEITDSLTQAEEWALKAQQLAKKVDKIEEQSKETIVDLRSIPNFYFATLYTNTLKERNSLSPKLNMQMQRFNDDF